MEKRIKAKLSALDPRFRKRFTELMSMMEESISLLYDAAIHDEKTGLYNHKFFDTILDMEIEKAKRGNQLSIIMIDIDFFKKLNDNYGHIKADELLKKLADLLNKQIRKSDVVARFGGEEFVILLPETDLRKAHKFAQRLKKAIHSDKVFKIYNLTVSGGIAQFKRRDSKKTLKKRVDKALYQAKKQGRDRFVIIR